MIIANNLIKVKSVQDTAVYSIENENEIQSLNYSELYTKAVKKLNFYRESGIKPQDKVFLVHGHNLSMLISFWACLLGGMIAVPIGRKKDYVNKTVKELYVRGDFFSADSGDSIGFDEELECYRDKIVSISDEELEEMEEDESLIYSGEEEDIVYIMCSSGSTGEPKGVAHTNRTISEMLATSKRIMEKCGDVYVSLFPLNHTAGVVLFDLFPIVNCANQIFISLEEASSVKTLREALNCITNYKGTCLGMPSSLLNLFTEIIIKDENSLWELSSLRTLIVCSEMVSSSSVLDFNKVMRQAGNENNVVISLYGSTETGGAITSTNYLVKEDFLTVNSRQLTVGSKISVVDETESDVMAFVPVGYTEKGVEIKIVDEEGNELEEDYVGNIIIRAKSIPSRYYNSDLQILSEDGSYSIGDIGFMHERQLYVVGRIKDFISLHGEKIVCSDMENQIEQFIGLKSETVKLVPVSSSDENNDMLCFCNYMDLDTFDEMAEAIWKFGYEKYFINITSFISLEEFPKTESGKVAKYKMAQMYLDGCFKENYQHSVNVKRNINNSIEEIEETVYELIFFATGNYPDRNGVILQSGLSSLEIAKICALINEQFGEVVNEVDIYDYFIFSQLVDHIYNTLKGE